MKSLLLAAGLVVALPQIVWADVIYTNTGNDFTFAIPPYTTSDKVTGKLTLTSPLPDNAVEFSPTVVSFEFTDGVQRLTQTNSSISTTFFSTSASGAITGWVTGGFVSPFAFIFSDSGFGTQDEGISQGGVGSNNDPGVWSGPTTVPEPATWVLMLAGFGGLSLAAARARRRPRSSLAFDCARTTKGK